MKKLLTTLRQSWQQAKQVSSKQHSYRVVEIEQDEHGDFSATIQVSGKNVTFKAKPEAILADDQMTDQFSQRDVRTLTYLGYMDLNNPKYKIVSKKSAPDGKMIFMVHKKGEQSVQIKTAAQIASDDEIIASLDQKDAHMIGYTVGSENLLQEEQMKAQARAALEAQQQKKLEQ